MYKVGIQDDSSTNQLDRCLAKLSNPFQDACDQGRSTEQILFHTVDTIMNGKLLWFAGNTILICSGSDADIGKKQLSHNHLIGSNEAL